MQTHQPNPWLLAIRPKTLPAAVCPVLVGTALAVSDHRFNLLPALAALACSVLLQIGVNLANDYFDSLHGIDTPNRLGPIRVTQSGLIPAGRVKIAIGVTFALAALIGAYLIVVGGWPALVIGIASILAALSYSAGPFPLASHGLGDLFVFVFFGLVAVCGAYYVQALTITWKVFLMSFPVGWLITAILVVNNLRDIETDRQVGKKTLAVLIGKRATRLEYMGLIALAYLLPLLLWAVADLSVWAAALPTLSLPISASLIHAIRRTEGRALNAVLAGTARLALVFSLLLSLGLIV